MESVVLQEIRRGCRWLRRWVGIAHPLNGSRLRRGPGIRQGCLELAVPNLAFLFFPNAPATTEAPPKPCRNWVSQWGSGRPPSSAHHPYPCHYHYRLHRSRTSRLPPRPLRHPARGRAAGGVSRVVGAPASHRPPPGLGGALAVLAVVGQSMVFALVGQSGPLCISRSVRGLCLSRSVGRSVARGLLSHSVSPWSWPRSVGRVGSSESFGRSFLVF